MSRYGNYGGYGEYESKAQKLAKSNKKIAALKKKNPDIEPILIEGRLLAKSWWGKAWNTNLEKYSDISNRLERGRSYVRNGSILDLQIHQGYISSQIMGSGSSIYKCRVDISPLSKRTWNKIKQQSLGSINSASELLAGKFPKELQELFAAKNTGLFPASCEIEKSCDCPDYASLCKHLAATLYGIGARFDHKPELIFTLRGIDSSELVSAVVEGHRDDLISRAQQADKKRQLKLKDIQLSKLFGIDFEMPD
jgi:uncharacterized Zn finger protein